LAKQWEVVENVAKAEKARVAKGYSSPTPQAF
jgi:hypothetical protein